MLSHRFVIYRHHLACSQRGLARWTKWRVVDCQPLADEQIWKLVTSFQQRSRAYFVLATTGEVIGRHSASSASMEVSEEELPLRSDWSSYIRSQLEVDGCLRPLPCSLSTSVLCQNSEEFEGGISKEWLRRMKTDRDGQIKVSIARRYIMANVVPNRLVPFGLLFGDSADQCALSSR